MAGRQSRRSCWDGRFALAHEAGVGLGFGTERVGIAEPFAGNGVDAGLELQDAVVGDQDGRIHAAVFEFIKDQLVAVLALRVRENPGRKELDIRVFLQRGNGLGHDMSHARFAFEFCPTLAGRCTAG